MKRFILLAITGLLFLASAIPALSQTQLVSVTPSHTATGVAVTTPLVLTFNGPMDMDQTSITVFDFSYVTNIDVNVSWNNQMNVMTCTPIQAWPAGSQIYWSLDGVDLFEDTVEAFGMFTTLGGAIEEKGGGTNATTVLTLAAMHFYAQTNASAPVLDPDLPFLFAGTVTLASNRTAHTVTLTTSPVAPVRTLSYNTLAPGTFQFSSFEQSLINFEVSYPPGIYQFDIKSAQSNQQVSVDFTLTQPPAPALANFASVTNVDAAKNFTLTWAPFPGGTAADYIEVTVGDVFASADLGKPGALNGTATSVSIPANTLSSNTSYDADITFYKYASTTNAAANYFTVSYRATKTSFTLNTGGQTFTPVELRNPGIVDGKFGFEFTAPAGWITVQYSSSLGGQWLDLYTTNAPGGSVRIVDPTPPGTTPRFYRLLR